MLWFASPEVQLFDKRRRRVKANMLDDKDVQLHSAALSIYEVYSPLRRTLLLIGGSAGFLLSFCTSIYLPALKVNRPATACAADAKGAPYDHAHDKLSICSLSLSCA
jgi:hypothetical protein